MQLEVVTGELCTGKQSQLHTAQSVGLRLNVGGHRGQELVLPSFLLEEEFAGQRGEQDLNGDSDGTEEGSAG